MLDCHIIILKEGMPKVAALLSLLVLAASLSTFPFSYSADANNKYEIPSYSLGTLTKNAKLTVILNLPYGGAASSLSLSIMDSTNVNTIFTFTGCAGSSCTLNWTVTDTAVYNLRALSSSATQEYSQFILYYLIAAVNNQNILKVTDIIRQHVAKLFYIDHKQTVTLTLSPADNPPANNYINLLEMAGGPVNSLVASSIQLIPTSMANSVATYNIPLASGYYGVVVTTAPTATVTVSTASDNYPCPYSAAFADINRVFTGCRSENASPSPSGLPCVNYDFSAQACLGCMNGFTLAQGRCFANTLCNARQYFHFGDCYDVSPTCDQFDASTGACLTCLNGTQYTLQNGQCVVPSTQCKTGETIVGTVCVSLTCGTFSQTTGECYTCITAAYYLSSGQCLPVNCGSGLYYSASAAKCLTLPANCLDFSLTLETCRTCANGSLLTQGVCIKQANLINCQLYNFTSSACTQCNPGYYLSNGSCALNPICGAGQTAVNGVCIVDPSACNPATQVFINQQCVFLPDNCRKINIFYQCIECAPKYEMRAGICQFCAGSNADFPCITCPLGTFPNSAGVCQLANPFCDTFSSKNGQCLTCSNGLAPVAGNCCDQGYAYKDGQCIQQTTNNGGSDQGGSYNNNKSRYGVYCKKANLELKICAECLSGHSFDQSGACSL